MKKLLGIVVLGLCLTVSNNSNNYFEFCNLSIGSNADANSGVCSKSIGGDCYAGIGGPCYDGIGGPAYDGIGGPAYDGIGGPCYDGIGGPAYDGIGGPCHKIGNMFVGNCPKPCVCKK
mgnify:CR=1 FL=1